MKIAGIVILVFGGLSLITAIIGATNGYETSFVGIGFVALGIFLISRADQKKEEHKKRKDWEEGK